MKLNKKFATYTWDSVYMDDDDNMSNCWFFGNLVLVETDFRKPRYCYLKKDLSCGRISEAEHNLFVDNFGADYTDTHGVRYNPDENVSDTYWLRAGQHTKLKRFTKLKKLK